MSDPGFASLGPSLLARKGGAKPAMRPQIAPLVADEAEIAELADEQLEDLGWNDMGHDDDGDAAFANGAEADGGADIVPINADVSADRVASGPGPIVRRQQRRLVERVLADAAMTGPADREPEYDEDEAESRYSGQTADEDVETEAYAAEDVADDWDADTSDADDSDDSDSDAGAPAYASLSPQTAPTARKQPINMAAPAAPTAPAAPVLRSPRLPATQAARRAAFTLRLDADRHLKLRLAATMQGVSAQALVTEALDQLLAEFDDLDIIANHLKRH
jgi:hypothetical protein